MEFVRESTSVITLRPSKGKPLARENASNETPSVKGNTMERTLIILNAMMNITRTRAMRCGSRSVLRRVERRGAATWKGLSP